MHADREYVRGWGIESERGDGDLPGHDYRESHRGHGETEEDPLHRAPVAQEE